MLTWLLRIESFVLGLFASAMLFIAVVLLPYWSSIPPLEFRSYFLSLSPYIGSWMFLLLKTSMGISILNFFVYWWKRKTLPLLIGIAMLLILGIVPIYIFVHGPINALLLGNTPLNNIEIANNLHQWLIWHWVRTVFGLLAFIFTLCSFREIT